MVDLGAAGGTSTDPIQRVPSQDLRAMQGEVQVQRGAEATLGPRAVARPEEVEEAQVEKEREPALFSAEDVSRLADRMNELVDITGRSLRFSVDGGDPGLNQMQVIDTNSGEVLKKIPADELLAVRRRMRDTVGVILNQII